MIIEFKVACKGETLKEVAANPFEQIIAKNYIQELHDRAVQEITVYEMFCAKRLLYYSTVCQVQQLTPAIRLSLVKIRN